MNDGGGKRTVHAGRRDACRALRFPSIPVGERNLAGCVIFPRKDQFPLTRRSYWFRSIWPARWPLPASAATKRPLVSCASRAFGRSRPPFVPAPRELKWRSVPAASIPACVRSFSKRPSISSARPIGARRRADSGGYRPSAIGRDPVSDRRTDGQEAGCSTEGRWPIADGPIPRPSYACGAQAFSPAVYGTQGSKRPGDSTYRIAWL